MRKTFVKKNPISFHRFYGSKSIYHRIIRFEFSWIFVLKSTRKTNSVLFEAVGLSCLQCMRYGHMRSFFYSKCRKCAFQPFLIHSILQSHDSHQGINQFFFHSFACIYIQRSKCIIDCILFMWNWYFRCVSCFAFFPIPSNNQTKVNVLWIENNSILSETLANQIARRKKNKINANFTSLEIVDISINRRIRLLIWIINETKIHR